MKLRNVIRTCFAVATALSLVCLGRYSAERPVQQPLSPRQFVSEGMKAKFGVEVATKEKEAAQPRGGESEPRRSPASEAAAESEAFKEPTRYEDLSEAVRERAEHAGYKFNGFVRNADGFMQAEFVKAE